MGAHDVGASTQEQVAIPSGQVRVCVRGLGERAAPGGGGTLGTVNVEMALKAVRQDVGGGRPGSDLEP